MTDCIVYGSPSATLNGSVCASPSKSQTLRAILFATMASGTSIISNILLSPDTTAMIKACEQLGAKINFTSDTVLEIQGTGGNLKQPDNIIDAGNSGIVLRFIASLAALLDSYTVITGDHSIRHNRPVKPLLEGLRRLGVFAESMRGNNTAPIIIKGPVLFNETRLDGYDSQPVSGLIIASCLLNQDTIINVDNPGEKPWLDLTLEWLTRLGVHFERDDYNKFIIHGGNNINSFNYFVPSDLSSISFPIAAAVITNSEIVINNVDLSDPQGDKILLEILKTMGANIVYNSDAKQLLVNKRNNELNGLKININNCIDAVNILSVIACHASGQTTISGAEVARHKECDRLKSVYTELCKMGADLIEYSDGLEIKNSELISCNNLHTYNDHRMVMALFVASIMANGDSVIKDVETVAKSYPDFFDHMLELGVKFRLV